MYICLVAGYRISYRIIKIVIRYPYQCKGYQVLFLLCWSHLWRNGNKEYPLLERFQLGNSMTSVQRHQDFEKSHGPTDPQRHLGTSMAVLIGLGWCRWRHFGCLRWWNFMARIMQQMATDLSQPILGFLAERVAGHPRFRWARRWKQGPQSPLRSEATHTCWECLDWGEQMQLELKLQLSQIYRSAVQLLHECFILRVHILLENPTRSRLWAVLAKMVKEFGDEQFAAWYFSFHDVDFDACMVAEAKIHQHQDFKCPKNPFSLLIDKRYLTLL